MASQRPTSPIDSLYSPILINPHPTFGASANAKLITPPPPQPRLKYPYPLVILAFIDIVYTARTYATSPPASKPGVHLLILSVVRSLVLSLVLGGSQRWRSRGGWVGASSVVSLGSVVWEVCKGQLIRSGRAAPKDGEQPSGEVVTLFLLVTGLLSTVEYLTFLLLLRLSPPSHRLQPFGLRVPPSAIQSPTVFAYSETPASFAPRHLPRHRRHESVASRLRFQRDIDSEPDPDDLQAPEDDTASAAAESDPEPVQMVDDCDFDDTESISTISDSSIIDLPPPLEPNRLIPPSVSLNTGLSLAALDQSPVIGPLIRRTRSARFTDIRNLGRRESAEAGGEASSGYGTFGMA